jgi:hypothetical protein
MTMVVTLRCLGVLVELVGAMIIIGVEGKYQQFVIFFELFMN